jgi:hypothetical protein
MKDEALKLALEALEEIALAGMSGTGQESDEAMTNWHARQAWKFIGIAAIALEPIKQALAAQPAPVQKRPQNCGTGYCSCIECVMEPAVPDAIHHTDTSETLEYIQGWNDCRAEMLKGRHEPV